MKILLINAINKQRKIEGSYPALGLAYLSSYLKQRIFDLDIRIIDSNVKNSIQTYDPNIVGISAVSQNFGIAVHYAKIAKENKKLVIVGGVHITMLPESLPNEADVGVLGEGEETFYDIVRHFKKIKKNFSYLKNIKSIIYRNSRGRIIKTKNREPIKNMDVLPFPDRNLLNIPRKQSVYLFSSRGCPYNCYFCASTRFWGRANVRFFSAEYVIREIEYLLKKYNPNLISFKDDLFIANKERLRKMVALIRERGIHKKTQFCVSCRANLVDEETVRLLKKMNVVMISMGLESGNPRILSLLKGGNVTVEQNKKAIELIKKYKIHTNASFIIGAPDETLKEMRDTYNFIKKSRLDSFLIYVLTPFPGTPVWENARKKGIVSDTLDWNKLTIDFKNNASGKIILNEKVSRKELQKIYFRFIRLQKRKELLNRIKRNIQNSGNAILKVFR